MEMAGAGIYGTGRDGIGELPGDGRAPRPEALVHPCADRCAVVGDLVADSGP